MNQSLRRRRRVAVDLVYRAPRPPEPLHQRHIKLESYLHLSSEPLFLHTDCWPVLPCLQLSRLGALQALLCQGACLCAVQHEDIKSRMVAQPPLA